MSLFKDFKEDVSQAMNELLDEEVVKEESEELELDDELQALFGEVDSDNDENDKQEAESSEESKSLDENADTIDLTNTSLRELDVTLEDLAGPDAFPEDDALNKGEEATSDMLETQELEKENVDEYQSEMDLTAEEDKEENDKLEDIEMSQNVTDTEVMENLESGETKVDETANFTDTPADDSTATITKGTEITGNIKTSGSLDIIGAIEGDVVCKGKLVVSGIVKGTSQAAEIFTDASNVTGDMVSDGSIKIGVGSVVVGNIKAASAVIAGAVKGNIDVDGPIIIDSTAVVVGDINSRSIQINNGAIMKGQCVQSYSDIDVNSFFEN